MVLERGRLLVCEVTLYQRETFHYGGSVLVRFSAFPRGQMKKRAMIPSYLSLPRVQPIYMVTSPVRKCSPP
jgi:hypothetical protein